MRLAMARPAAMTPLAASASSAYLPGGETGAWTTEDGEQHASEYAHVRGGALHTHTNTGLAIPSHANPSPSTDQSSLTHRTDRRGLVTPPVPPPSALTLGIPVRSRGAPLPSQPPWAGGWPPCPCSLTPRLHPWTRPLPPRGPRGAAAPVWPRLRRSRWWGRGPAAGGSAWPRPLCAWPLCGPGCRGRRGLRGARRGGDAGGGSLRQEALRPTTSVDLCKKR